MSVVGSPITVGASSKKFNSNAVAEAYSAAQAYAVGDYATWKGSLYKNKTAIPLPGEAWNAAHWEPVTLDDEMALFDGLVIASETQPTNGRNKIWFRLNGSEVSIPEMADLNALMEAIAAREDSNTATRAYTAGDLIFVGTALYKATGNIAAGALIVPGTNVRGTTIEAQLGEHISTFARQNKLQGKKIMFFGDSITAKQERYVDRLLAQTGMVLVHNFAVSGSAWVHKRLSIKAQVQELLNAESPYEVPDIVFISAGTNDVGNEISQSLEIEQYFTQVIDDAVSYIPYENLPNDNITRAMRWCISKIQNLYPNAMVFVTTPIQAAAGTRPPSALKTVADIIKLTANRMSVRVIDAFEKSGIYGEYENAAAEGKYLKDGLHPKSGTTILGDFYAQELNTQYCR